MLKKKKKIWKKNNWKRKNLNEKIFVNGIIHAKFSLNNTFFTLTDLSGNTKAWSSCGSMGFKGGKRSSRFSGQIAAENIGNKAVNLGYSKVILHLNGVGKGRNVCTTGLKKSGIEIQIIKDFTSIPHNGCRPPKIRRI